MEYKDVTKLELERLTLLSEECAEVQQVVSKIIRFGFDDFHPKNNNEPNRLLLTKELGDLMLIIDLLVNNLDLKFDEIEEFKEIKKSKINRYLRYNKV